MWKTAFKKILIVTVCLGRPYHFNFFKGCLPRILLGLFLNTLSHLYLQLKPTSHSLSRKIMKDVKRTIIKGVNAHFVVPTLILLKPTISTKNRLISNAYKCQLLASPKLPVNTITNNTSAKHFGVKTFKGKTE